MKTRIILSLLLWIGIGISSVSAHQGGHHAASTTWTLQKGNSNFEASFLSLIEGIASFENAKGEVTHHALTALSQENQTTILNRQARIEQLNGVSNSQAAFGFKFSIWGFLSFTLLFVLLGILAIKSWQNPRNRWVVSGISIALLIGFLSACNQEDPIILPIPANNTTTLQSIFETFTGVTTSFDETYFYISSNGLPSHLMMRGITNWQQQVPIDQEYTGTNSWSIPLQPAFADEPISTATNLLKGALAIAANGVPIFNPLNNRGEDAFAIGELDEWGGHCGRADDYHYHIPPTHLQDDIGAGQPIAYALDGFPVYGETTEDLDECLGILNDDGSYQYHTTTTFPYFMACVKGEVSIDPATTAPEDQIIPQAMSMGVRPALEPLAGAEITHFESTGSNAYSLNYTIGTDVYTINYSWDGAGNYSFTFIDPGGSSTTENYIR